MRTSKDDGVAAFCVLEHFTFCIFAFFAFFAFAFAFGFGFIFFAFYYDIIYNIKI